MAALNYLFLLFFTLIAFFVSQSQQTDGNSGDTSLYDFVAFNLLEDYVDLLEMTAWFARKVKNHIDELVDESFTMLTKQQDLLQPALELADKYNRPDCAEDKIFNVTDTIFKEYFNMNINCPMIGQKMAVFFHELHNITERIIAIHRSHINLAPGCGPPHYPTVERNCLQNIINECKKDTGNIRKHMQNLNYDVEDFMDGQIEEAFLCSLNGMRNVRNVTKQAVQDIHCCLDIEENYEIRKKYESPLLKAAMGKTISGPLSNIDISKELKDREERLKAKQYHQTGPQPPHYQPTNPQFYGHPGNPQHHPGIQQQFAQHPVGVQPQFAHQPEMQQQDQIEQPFVDMQPHNQMKPVSENPPVWKINPKNIPKYAKKENEGSIAFDPNTFGGNVEYNYDEEDQKSFLNNDNYHSSL